MTLSNTEKLIQSFEGAIELIETKGWFGSSAWRAGSDINGECITNAVWRTITSLGFADDGTPEGWIDLIISKLNVDSIGQVWDLNDSFTDYEEGKEWALSTLRSILEFLKALIPA